MQDRIVIIIAASCGKVGLLIDEIGDIPEVAEEWIQLIPEDFVSKASSIVNSVVKHPGKESTMEVLRIVSVERNIARAAGKVA